MLWIIGISILVIIFFLPIPIKLNIVYEDRVISLSIYNRKLNLKKKVSKRKANIKNAKFYKRIVNSMKRDTQTILLNLFESRFKPSLKLGFELNYGFEDAAATGIAYGVFSSLSPFFYELFDRIFKVRDFKFKVIPHYNNPMLNFRISSIISINLAKIIYMLKKIYF